MFRFLAVVYPVSSLTTRTVANVKYLILATWLLILLSNIPLWLTHSILQVDNSQSLRHLFEINLIKQVFSLQTPTFAPSTSTTTTSSGSTWVSSSPATPSPSSPSSSCTSSCCHLSGSLFQRGYQSRNCELFRM